MWKKLFERIFSVRQEKQSQTEKSRSSQDKMETREANTGTILCLWEFNSSSPCKQKEEVALCDWLAWTSCLWLYIQKQNQGLWTSHDSVSPREPLTRCVWPCTHCLRIQDATMLGSSCSRHKSDKCVLVMDWNTVTIISVISLMGRSTGNRTNDFNLFDLLLFISGKKKCVLSFFFSSNRFCSDTWDDEVHF